MATDLINCDTKGSEMSLYYDSTDAAGTATCASPTWVYNKAITGDMSINETEDEEENSSRDPEQIYVQYSESKIKLEISGECMVDTDYDGWKMLNAARAGSYGRNFLALTSYLTQVGSIGVKGRFRNTDRSISGPESGPLRQTWKLMPASCVLSACRVQPVRINVASTVATYDPGTFTISFAMNNDTPSLAEQIKASDLYRGVNHKWSDDVELFTDVGPVIQFLGVDKADKLAFSLVEANRVEVERPSKSARRPQSKKMGLAGFIAKDLLAALNEIVLNEKTKEVKDF